MPQPNAICDRCGFEYRLNELRKEWTGFMVCADCFDRRHPQEFVRGVADSQGVRPNMRPEPAATYVVEVPAVVRSKIEQGALGTGQTMTFTASTAGNLLLLYCGPDKASGAFSTPTGWAAFGTEHTSGVGVSAKLFWKISDGTETSVTVSWANSCRGSLSLVEVSGAIALDQFGISVLNATITNQRTTGEVIARGEIVGLLPQLAIAFAHVDEAGDTDAATSHGWTNDFTEFASMGMGAADYNIGTTPPSVSIASKALSDIEQPRTTFSWTGDAADECMGMLVTIKPTNT